MNLAIIFGGVSCEHDIAIITGEQLISKCNSSLYDIYPIYIDKNGDWYFSKDIGDIDNIGDYKKLSKKCLINSNDGCLYIEKGNKFKRLVDIDVAIICMHGLRGEDGAVAGLLELANIPYSNSSICASSVCLDKCIFKTFCKGKNIGVIDGFELTENKYLKCNNCVVEEIQKLGFPVIIKPSRLGSSIGISVCKSLEELDEKIKFSLRYDKKLLVEKFVEIKKEVNIALLENKGEIIYSNTEEPINKDEILSFDDKYRKGSDSEGFEGIKRIMPASITKEQQTMIENIATDIYVGLQMFGVVRFDFIIDKDDNVYVNEVNTIPGSMANYLFDKQIYNYPKLIDIFVSNAIHRKSIEDKVEKIYNTDVISNGFDGFKK